MKNDKKILSTREVFSQGMATLRATSRATLLIVILGMILPQMALSLAFDAYSGGVVEALRATFALQSGNNVGFMTLMAPVVAYLGEMGAFVIAIMLMILVAYFALVHIAVRHHRQEEAPAIGTALWLGLKTVVPRGIVVFISLMLLTVVGQVLIAPAVLIAVMSFAIPVILVAERRSALRALWEALTLRYVRQSEYSGWTVLFMLLSLGAFFYTAAALIGLLSQWLLLLDQSLGLPRGPWMMTFGEQPFGPIYVGVTLLETVAMMSLLGVFPAFTAALYFLVVGRRPLGQA